VGFGHFLWLWFLFCRENDIHVWELRDGSRHFFVGRSADIWWGADNDVVGGVTSKVFGAVPGTPLNP